MVTDHQPLVRIMDQQVLARVQTRWLRLGLFQSIRPTIKCQPRKANVVADALSRSQRKLEEVSMDDSIVAVAAMIERHVFSTKWSERGVDNRRSSQMNIAYKEDKGPRCSVYEATLGIEIRGFLSDSIRSNGKNDGGSTERSSFLSLCDNKS